MARIKKVKADHRADTLGKPWAGIPHAVLDSLAYLHCDLWERAVLVEIVRAMNGYNNGAIAVSQRQLAVRLKTSNFRRIGQSIASLMSKGLIDIAIEGQWKERMARQYRLTFVNTGAAGRFKSATNEYRDWRPEAKSGVEPVSARARQPAEHALAGDNNAAELVSAVLNGKLQKTAIGPAEPVSSLIGKPYPPAEDDQCVGYSSGAQYVGG